MSKLFQTTVSVRGTESPLTHLILKKGEQRKLVLYVMLWCLGGGAVELKLDTIAIHLVSN